MNCINALNSSTYCMAKGEGLEPPWVLTDGFGDHCNRRYANPSKYWYPVKVTILCRTIISRVLYL